MSTITYKEIVRKVHPDLNPHVEDAGAKMAEIQKHKNSPSVLFSLAAKWGLVDGGSSHSHNDNVWSSFRESSHSRSRRNDFRADSHGNVTRLHREDGVVVRHRRRLVFGKIKDIETVKNGKRKGWMKFAIALTNGRILYVKKPDNLSDMTLMIHNGLDTRQAARADEAWKQYIESKKSHEEAKERAKERKAQENREDLGTNRNYRGRDVWAFVRTKGNWFRVTRTTEKSVFYEDYFGNEKRCQFSSVIRVRKNS